MKDVAAVDYQAIRFWIDIAALAWAVAVSLFVLWDRRNKVTQEAVAAMRADHAKQLDKLRAEQSAEIGALRAEQSAEIGALRASVESRRARIDEELSTLHARLSDAPRKQDIDALYGMVRQVSEQTNKLCGAMEAAQASLAMINQHLLAQ